MINKDKVIFILINRSNGRSPDICIDILKGLRRRDCVCMKRKFVTFINKAMRTRKFLRYILGITYLLKDPSILILYIKNMASSFFSALFVFFRFLFDII